MNEIEILQPDDFHHHLRDGDALQHVVQLAAQQFRSVIVMPNLKPPVRTVADATAYRQRILQHTSTSFPDFNPLMTLYLTDQTQPEDILAAKATGFIHAVKYYPAGATTNSEFGVTSITRVEKVLETMASVGMLLLIHGEVVDPNVDIFDREKEFIETILKPIIAKFPSLKIVMEHITTADAVKFVESTGPNLAATITAHHLLYNRNDIFRGGICPHMYCLPILKREEHRQALLAAATSGNPKFFVGTDSAPHAIEAKESSCGCAGIFTAHAAIELYAEAFELANALDKLEGFLSRFGQAYYGIPVSTKTILIRKESWTVPENFQFGSSFVKPLRSNQTIAWKKISN